MYESGQLGAKIARWVFNNSYICFEEGCSLVRALHICLPFCKHLGVLVTIMFDSCLSCMLYQLLTCQLKSTCMWFWAPPQFSLQMFVFISILRGAGYLQYVQWSLSFLLRLFLGFKRLSHVCQIH